MKQTMPCRAFLVTFAVKWSCRRPSVSPIARNRRTGCAGVCYGRRRPIRAAASSGRAGRGQLAAGAVSTQPPRPLPSPCRRIADDDRDRLLALDLVGFAPRLGDGRGTIRELFLFDVGVAQGVGDEHPGGGVSRPPVNSSRRDAELSDGERPQLHLEPDQPFPRPPSPPDRAPPSSSSTSAAMRARRRAGKCRCRRRDRRP